MIKAYIDTNILVDLVLSRQEFLPDAQRVFALGYADEAERRYAQRTKRDLKKDPYYIAMREMLKRSGF